MNNAYLGSVHSSKLRPKFVWEPSTAESTGEIRYELQLSTNRDFEGEKIEETVFETEFLPTNALPVSFVAPVGARYFWHVRACLRNSCSEYSRTWYANVGRVIKDFNGDGFSDLAVGAPSNDLVALNGGIIYLYHGSQTGVTGSTPRREIRNSDVIDLDERFGEYVSSVGDVNGDGYGDLAVGIPPRDERYSNDRAYLYLGSSAGADSIVDLVFKPVPYVRGFGALVRGAGDINGDAFDDLLIQSHQPNGLSTTTRIYLGGSLGSIDNQYDAEIELPKRTHVAESAGDIDGDGFGDIVIGASEDEELGNLAGAAYIFWGGESSFYIERENTKLLAYEIGEVFGYEASSLGDINGDGFSDLGIGILRSEELGDGRPGRAYVYLGGASGIDRSTDLLLVGTDPNDSFGSMLCSAGDVNSDGYADVLVAGRDVYLYLTDSIGVLDDKVDAILPVYITDPVVPGRAYEAGDLNGDGIGDIGISRPYMGDGRVELFLGPGTAPFNMTPHGILLGVAQEQLGF